MSRRYAVPVQTVTRHGQPHRFTWRGRAYVVQEVLGHWVSGTPWWQAPAGVTPAGVTPAGDGIAGDDIAGDDIEVWRVEAQAGVYDLVRAGEQWSLSRIAD